MNSYLDIDDEDIFSAYGHPEIKTPSSKKPGARLHTPLAQERKNVQTSLQRATASPKVLFSPAGIISSQSESKSYGSRSKAGDVVFRYNCKDSLAWKESVTNKSEWKILKDQTYNSNFKYMFQRTRGMASIMDKAVSELSESILKYYSLEPSQSLQHSTAEDEVYVGRIRNDGKLTAGSIFLEGTLDGSQGHIVALDLSSLDEYFLFPGQVLAIAGKNNLGKCVSVSKVFVPRPLPFSSETIGVNRATGPLSVLVAAGPFTPSDSLLYEPLKDLVDLIKKTQPDVCILIGPFLDASHSLIEPGKMSFEETFEESFKIKMQDLFVSLENVNSQVIVVSSPKDVHHNPVYPSPPYDIDINGSRNIMFVPDPAMISIGGVQFGITSTDTLMHLGKFELANAAVSSDRMGRISRHLISQRTFYPIYPADVSVNLDLEKWEMFGKMTCTPHVLIVPSDLRYFIKDVDGTVVVNPERLTKGHSGGTYARIKIALPTEPEDNIGDGTPIADFVIGEIVKI